MNRLEEDPYKASPEEQGGDPLEKDELSKPPTK
jgi:hypothetical protein